MSTGMADRGDDVNERLGALLADLGCWAQDGDEIEVKHAVHARRFREASERVERLTVVLEAQIRAAVVLLDQHIKEPKGSRDDFLPMLRDRLQAAIDKIK